MPQLYVKHNTYRELNIGPLNEGLDYSQDETSISEQALSKCMNWEYDYQTGKLRTVPGLTRLFDAGDDIDSLYYFDDEGIFIFTIGTSLYKSDLATKIKIGTITANVEPMYAQFNNCLLIASGGKLQKYVKPGRVSAWSAGAIISQGDMIKPIVDNGQIYVATTAGTGGLVEPTWNTTLNGYTTDGTAIWQTKESLTEVNSPDSDIVFIRMGRVVVSKKGSDYVTYSAIGDETNYTINGTVESDAQNFGVSLQDSMDISCIVPLSSDLLIYKRGEWSNMAGRIIGEPLDFVFKEVSRNAYCNNRFSGVQAANDVFFLGHEGFKNMSNVVDYGDIKQIDAGIKINKWLIGRIDYDDSRLWVVPSKRQIYIRSQYDQYITIFHYFNNAYTIRAFNGVLTGLVDNKGSVYISKGHYISKLDTFSSKDDNIQIISELRTKTYKFSREVLIQRLVLSNIDYLSGSGNLNVGNIAMSFVIKKGNSPIIYNNDDIIKDNATLIFSSKKYIPKEKRQVDRQKIFYVNLIVNNGSMAFNQLLIGLSEVSY